MLECDLIGDGVSTEVKMRPLLGLSSLRPDVSGTSSTLLAGSKEFMFPGPRTQFLSCFFRCFLFVS